MKEIRNVFQLANSYLHFLNAVFGIREVIDLALVASINRFSDATYIHVYDLSCVRIVQRKIERRTCRLLSAPLVILNLQELLG